MSTAAARKQADAAAGPLAFATMPHGTPPVLITVIEDAARSAFDRHGLKAFVSSREATIAHETGHAIVATHEGLAVRSVSVFSRSVPPFGTVWGGWCTDAGGIWTSGPDSSAADDLRRARIIIAGLAGEAATHTDLPGSSIDELGLSQLIGLNAAAKLDDDPGRSDQDYDAYAQRLWHEQVWDVTFRILLANWEPFNCLAQCLQKKEKVKGPRLRQILGQIRRIES
jgi:hypothetical protein